MFSTAKISFTSQFAAVALVGALLVAAVGAAVSAPAPSAHASVTRLAPLVADEGIRLGSVSADGDCVMVKHHVGNRETGHLNCVQ